MQPVRGLLPFDHLTGRRILVRAAVIVAIRATGFHCEVPVDMAITAIHLSVYLVKLQAGDPMREVLLIPAAVATIAIAAESADLLTGWMTSPTIKFLVIAAQRPAG